MPVTIPSPASALVARYYLEVTDSDAGRAASMADQLQAAVSAELVQPEACGLGLPHTSPK